MNANPEFERQLWLEFSVSRLASVSLVLGVLLALTRALDDAHFKDATANTAAGLYLLMVSWWGARQAVDSVLDEQRNRTWDTQRLSALGPWAMVWGKLFGSTLVVWYGAVLCLLAYGLATADSATLPWFCAYALVGGLALQSFSFFLALLALRLGHAGGGISVLALLLALSFGPATLSALLRDARVAETVAWYGLPLPAPALTLSALGLALFWAMVANYRLMAQELCLRTLPWVWLAFALFLSVYLTGFASPSSVTERFGFLLAAGFGVCLTLTYLDLLTELNEPMRFKRLLTYAEQQDWRRFGEALPPWCASLALAAVFGLPLSLLGWAATSEGSEFRAYPLPILLLSLRDIGIFLLFRFGKNPRRALMASLLCAVLLYGVIPGIFTGADLPGLAAAVLPLRADSAVLAFAAAALQAAAALSLAHARWREAVYRPQPGA
ncbi:MAG: ABC transporter permease [Candidatus Methylumidiphilus sp.]